MSPGPQLGLRLLPKAAASRLAGRLARHPASRLLIPWFQRHYRVDTSVAVVPAGGFTSLQEFFCRALKPEARPVALDPGVLVSPVDATVGACGPMRHDVLLQAKGETYRLAALLGDATLAPPFHGGVYCTLYLAPSDYHRVHAPLAGRVSAARHRRGTRWPVNPSAVRRVPGLFTANERLIVDLDTPAAGKLVLVLVGACLVGGIQLVATPPFELQRGEELGRFEFGSTVIVVAPPAAGLELAVIPGARVLMGEVLMRAAAGAAKTPPPAAC